MKSIKEEYILQAAIRDWEFYLAKLPMKDQGLILDFGCGIGIVTHLLSLKYSEVIGLDENSALIEEANRRVAAENVKFITTDLRNIEHLGLPSADGIWCSFTAAYFPDLKSLLPKWALLLKPGGWIALVEANDLFGHAPLSTTAHQAFLEHEQRLFESGRYDVMMGGKLASYLRSTPLRIVFEVEMDDPELAFTGPASKSVISSWDNRLERMSGFRRALGAVRFGKVKKEFLNCLSKREHNCLSRVNFLIAERID